MAKIIFSFLKRLKVSFRARPFLPKLAFKPWCQIFELLGRDEMTREEKVRHTWGARKSSRPRNYIQMPRSHNFFLIKTCYRPFFKAHSSVQKYQGSEHHFSYQFKRFNEIEKMVTLWWTFEINQKRHFLLNPAHVIKIGNFSKNSY